MESFNLSKCDKCERIFDERKEELTYCDKCDHCLCASCYPRHHDNLTELCFVYQQKRRSNACRSRTQYI